MTENVERERLRPTVADESDDRLELADLVDEIVDQLATRHGVGDALMLRKVKRAREQLREIDDVLETLERYFTAGAP